MTFGINTFVWGPSFGRSNFHLLPRIKEAGFASVELPLINPDRIEVDAVRRELETNDLACTTVSIVPAGSSLASSDAASRERASAHFERCFAVARDLGATLLSGPFYTPVGQMTGTRRTSDEWMWAVDSWQRLTPAVRAAGIEIGIEPLNRFETYFLNTAADGVAFCRAVADSRIGLLVDTFHANIEEKSIGAAVRLAAPYIKHLHASENDRGVPGSGHVAWTEFFTAVAEIGYDRSLTIESFGFAHGAMSAAAAIWRDLAPTADAIAFDGVAFLREKRAESESRAGAVPE